MRPALATVKPLPGSRKLGVISKAALLHVVFSHNHGALAGVTYPVKGGLIEKRAVFERQAFPVLFGQHWLTPVQRPVNGKSGIIPD